MWEWLKWIEIKEINNGVIIEVIVFIIIAVILWLTGSFKKLIKYLSNRKKSIPYQEIESNYGDYRNATYQIRIKEFEKINVMHLIDVLNEKLDCNAVLVSGSERYENGLLHFDIQVRIRSGIDHKEIHEILSFNQNGQYEVHGVSNTG